MQAAAKLIGDVAAAIQRADMQRATELAMKGLKSGLRHPLLFNIRAQFLEAQGRDREALDDLEHAHSLAPDDAGVLEALGLLQLRLGMGLRARATFARLLASRPSYAYGYYCAGLSAEAVGDLVAADRHFRSSDRLDPRRATTLSRIAAIAARRGQWADARAFADRAIALDAREIDSAFVHVSADLAEGHLEAAIDRARTISTDASLPEAIRATACSLVADGLDAQGKTDEAFAAYESASRHFLKGFGSGFEARERMVDFVERLRGIVEGTSPAAAPTLEASPAAGHVFVLGFPRSGTTLLERILASHPQIVSAEEREYLAEPAAQLLSDKAGFERLQSLSDTELAALRAAYWTRVREDGVVFDDKYFVDKLPLNTLKIPLLRRLFPAARIVLAVRDPRDVILSCFRRRFAMNPAMFELVTLTGAARFYDAVMSFFESCHRTAPFPYHVTKYETLVDDPRSEIGRLCSFIGIDWSDDLLDFARLHDGRAIATPSANQIKRGLYRDGVGQWRRYETHLQSIEPIIMPWLTRVGYAS